MAWILEEDGIYYCRQDENCMIIHANNPSQEGNHSVGVETVASRFSVHRGDGKSSFTQCVFNLSNKLMGIGLLGLPYALKMAGWVAGLTSFVVLAFVTWQTSIFIGRELNGTPRPLSHESSSSLHKDRIHDPLRTFPDIAKCAFGETGYLLLSLVFYFELFSSICILFVTIGDHLDPLFPNIGAEGLTALNGVISLIPTLMLTSPARMASLSLVGTCCTITIVLTVVVSAILRGQEVANNDNNYYDEDEMLEDSGPFYQRYNASGLLFSFGLIAFCFAGHAIVPSIYTSMEHPEQFESMVTLTYLIVTATCIAVAVSGYYMFGSTVLDQITLSLERSTDAMWIMDCLTMLLVLTCFSKITITMFPIATGLEDMVASSLLPENFVNERLSADVASALIKFTLTILALLVSVFVPSFSYLVALVGMICTMTVSVIFPSAAYLQMFGSKLGLGVKALCVVFILCGVIISITGTIYHSTG